MPNPNIGTGFTNLSQLLQANQNNKLGSTIQQGVQGGINKLNQGVGQAQQQFNTDVNNANQNTQANQQFVGNTIQGIVAPPANINAPQGQTAPQPGMPHFDPPHSGQEYPNQQTPTFTPMPNQAPPQTMSKPGGGMVQALASPTQPATPSAPAPKPTSSQDSTNLASQPGSFGYASNAQSGTNQTGTTGAPSAGDISKFAQYMQGNYAGPNQLQNYAGLQAQGQNLQDIGRNVNTPGGLQSLLQRYIGGPQYNEGQQRLDTLLLGQTGYPQLQNIARSTQNISNVPQTAEAQAQAQAATTALGNQQFAQNIRGQLAAAENPILQNIQGGLQSQDAKNAQIQATSDQINQYLNSPLGQAAPSRTTTTSGQNPGGTGMQAISFPDKTTLNPNAPRIGGPSNNVGQPRTTGDAITRSVDDAIKSGLITQDQAGQMYEALNSKTESGNFANPLLHQNEYTPGGATSDQLMKIMQGSFNPYTAANPYTMQQGASAQQAAQLNALSQLGGQGKQFATYGGVNPATAGFDMAKFMNQINSLAAPDRGRMYNADGSFYEPNYQLPGLGGGGGPALGAVGGVGGRIVGGPIGGAAGGAAGNYIGDKIAP